MKSDLTCPVEVVSVTIENPAEDTKEEGGSGGQLCCLIDFFNLSEKAIESIQMNLICFDASQERLGGRLVRATARGAGRENFSGRFVPDHVSNAARVEASVEKVWFQDGVIWRREERNVREYTPNVLPDGRELDRLRTVAGADAAGYAREEDTVWLCVCGRANRTSDDHCLRCGRERTQVLHDYSFAAIDSTVGRKERLLEQQTQENLKRSSELTLRQMTKAQQTARRRRRRMTAVIVLLLTAAVLLTGIRWGVPFAAVYYANTKLNNGLAADAKSVFDLVNGYWPDEFGAVQGALLAEETIIDGLIQAGTADTLDQAQRRAQALGDETREEQALLARAQLAIHAGDTQTAETLLSAMPQSEQAQRMMQTLVYAIAAQAMEQLDYATAIERFASLGEYEDAAAQREECIYLFGRQLMRAGKYEEACDQFMQVTGQSDAISLIRQCRYQLAQQNEAAGEYLLAAPLYESLGIYEEAETRGKFCRYTAGLNALAAGDLSTAAEQMKLAGNYEDAAARFADAVFTLGSEALSAGEYESAIGWLEQLERTEQTVDALNRAVYAYAEQLEQGGQRAQAAIEFASLGSYQDATDRANALEYGLALEEKETAVESALTRFELLRDYRDAAEQADACRYQLAVQAMTAGNAEDALTQFIQLGDYQDAAAQAQRCRYRLAGQAMDAQDYEAAALYFSQCGAYLDAEDGVLRARYAQADAMQTAGTYEAAAKAFAALGSYEDAKQRVTQNEDAWLGAAYTSALLDSELGDYASVIDTLEPYWQCELPERYAQIAQMYVDACLARSRELIGINRPLDALPVLERIAQNKTAQQRLDAYVYRIIGRWSDTRGTEYIFRRDGSCLIAGVSGYFGGSGYEITVGSEPYPTKAAYSVVNLRNETLTLRNLSTDSTIRLSYRGEPEMTAEDGE